MITEDELKEYEEMIRHRVWFIGFAEIKKLIKEVRRLQAENKLLKRAKDAKQ